MKTSSEIFKKYINKKIILGITAFILMLVFVGVTSFVPYIITGDKLKTASFWTNELVIIAITIFSVMSIMYVAISSNAQNERSELARAKVAFKNSVESLKVNHFCQWIKRKLQPADLQAIKERELRKLGLDHYAILKLNDAELLALATAPQKYDGIYYDKLTIKKIKRIQAIKENVKQLRFVEPEYYLTVQSISGDKTISERSGKEGLKKTLTMVFSVFSKIVIVTIPVCIFAAMTRDLTQTNPETVQVIATFTSRILAMISGAFVGYITGTQLNDIDADYINLRITTHTLFLQDNDFVPLTQQELAKTKYIESVKEQQKQIPILSPNESIDISNNSPVTNN